MGILSSYASHFIGDIEACRLWLISFDLHHLHASTNAEWKSKIDASVANENWYLRNKNKYGNESFMLRRTFAYYAFSSTVAVSTNVYSKAVDPRFTAITNFVDLGTFLLPLVA